MRISLQVDGSIEIENMPEGFYLKNFRREGNRFIPKFPECKARENHSKVSPCGKRAIFEWFCRKYNKNVVVSDCEGCNGKEP